MGTLCFSLSLLISLSILFSGANSVTHRRDTEALKQFKNGLDPNSIPQGSCLSSWDFTLDPCDNLFSDKFTCGFRCEVGENSGENRITELTLDQAGYSGSIGSSDWNLPYLQTLDLSGNYFTGSIPESISNLVRLRRLCFSRNSLFGSVPNSIGSITSLEEIYLDNNNLTGKIPSNFNRLTNLKRLEIQGNKFSGGFPDLSRVENLNFLDASDNQISGEFPAKLPVSLIELTMRNNKLEGNIPATGVTGLVYLQVLDLSHNKLTGSVPWTLFTHPSLQQLTLSDNGFGSVEVPADWGIRSELIAVDLSNNELFGFLPVFMGWMPKLSALVLENNMFSGMIPTQYAVKAVVPGEGVSQFQRLFLGGNYLFGPIPNPLLDLKPGSVMVRLGDNCLYRCPVRFFFCQGGEQKPLMNCKSFVPVRH